MGKFRGIIDKLRFDWSEREEVRIKVFIYSNPIDTVLLVLYRVKKVSEAYRVSILNSFVTCLEKRWTNGKI